MYDNDGKRRMSIDTLQNGEASMKWFDEAKNLRMIAGTASLITRKSDNVDDQDVSSANWLDVATLAFYDRDGSRRIQVGSETNVAQTGNDVNDELGTYDWSGVIWFDKQGEAQIKSGTDSSGYVTYPSDPGDMGDAVDTGDTDDASDTGEAP
jgi:hypothetical protein